LNNKIKLDLTVFIPRLQSSSTNDRKLATQGHKRNLQNNKEKKNNEERERTYFSKIGGDVLVGCGRGYL